MPKGVRVTNRVNENGDLLCGTCLEYKRPEAFVVDNSKATKRAIKCKACCQEYQLKRKWGLTRAQYDDLLRSQGDRCAICDIERCRTGKDFAVDHDHSCCSGRVSCGKCVRGLVCLTCNMMLGYAYDRVDVLTKAIGYLQRERTALAG